MNTDRKIGNSKDKRKCCQTVRLNIRPQFRFFFLSKFQHFQSVTLKELNGCGKSTAPLEPVCEIQQLLTVMG